MISSKGSQVLDDNFRLVIGDQAWERQKVREVCQTWPGGLYFFTKYVMVRPKLRMDLHFAWCNFIQLHPWIGDGTNNTILAPGYQQPPRLSHRKTGYMPREHFKSTVVSESFPLWLLANVDRNMSIAIVSAVSENTEKWLKKMREAVDYNPIFRWLYPELRRGPKWDATQIELTRDKGGDAQASISALSIGQGLASQHFDYIICDDLVNEQTAESEVEMERAVRLYWSLEEILKGWKDSKGFLVVGTPWGRADVLHETLQEADRGTRYKWGIGTGCEEVGVMPHFTVSEELKEMYPDELIPTVDMNRPILPSECDEEKLIAIKNQNVNKLYLNYACKPFDEGRNGFHLDRIGLFGEMPDGSLLCKCHPDHKHNLADASVIAVSDPAYTKDKENCETAILIGAKFGCGCKFLLYEYGGFIQPFEYVDLAPQIAEQFKTHLRAWGVEDEALQVTLKQWMEERQRKGEFPYNVPIFGLKIKNREKDGRIAKAQTPVNNREWHIKADMRLIPGKNNVMHQLYQWPLGIKRDRADAFAYFEQGWTEFPPPVQSGGEKRPRYQNNARRGKADVKLMQKESNA